MSIYLGENLITSVKRGSTDVEKIYSGDKLAYQKKIEAAKAAGARLLLLSDLATGVGLPKNSPLTNPWKDLSGNGNNATPTNFAGTAASGVDISDPLRPSWVLDGADDFFSLVNTPSLDITSGPLAVFATVKLAATAVTSYIIAKNLDASENVQYGIFLTSTFIAQAFLEGSNRNTTEPLNIGQWYNIGFIWDGTAVRAYVNLVKDSTDGSYSGTLTSQPYMFIGKRGTASYRFKGNIASISIYAGVNATDEKVLAAEWAISAPYLAA